MGGVMTAPVLASALLSVAAIVAPEPPYGPVFLVAAIVAWLCVGASLIARRRTGR
jgi:hypothetical protein